MIMSRRKQSNPKPLKREEDEEWESDMSNVKKITKNFEVDYESDVTKLTANTLPVNDCDDQNEDSDNSPLANAKKVLSNDDSSSPGTVTEDGDVKDQLEDNGNQAVQFSNSGAVVNTKGKTRLKSHLGIDPAIILTLQKQQQHSTKLEKKESIDLAKSHESVSLPMPNSVIKPPTSISSQNSSTVEPQKPLQQQITQPPFFICSPCRIRFSSFSTLEAHQTFYCSFRKNQNPLDQDDLDDKTKDNPDLEQKSQGTNGNKNLRVMKQHVCNHCSYSADKRASLNRHMRMHSLSPNSSSTNLNIGSGGGSTSQSVSNIVNGVGVDMEHVLLSDRYCSDCKIKFSSLKTFRAHKMHYCSSRHNNNNNGQKDTNNVPESAPHSPVNEHFNFSNPASFQQQPVQLTIPQTPVNLQQSFLALPTNPILIIPYNLLQNASLISPPTNFSNTEHRDSPFFLFPNGSFYPMTQAFSMALMSLQQQQQQQHHQQQQQQQQPQPIKTPVAKATTLEVSKKRPLSTYEESPLDLSIKKVKTEHLYENDKSRSATPEQLICTPSFLVGDNQAQSPKPRIEPEGSSRSNSPRSLKDSNRKTSPLPLTIPTPFSTQFLLNNAMTNPSILTNELAIKFLNEAQSQLANSGNNTQILPQLIQPPPPPPPQIIVKQGVSRCQECNIVFCKYENYLAHKKHYCSARSPDEHAKKSLSPPVANNNATSASTNSGKVSPHYQQIICLACGIKFTTIDNLKAHQMYYCIKNKDVKIEPQNVPRMKCLKCKKIVDMGHKCNINEKPQVQAQQQPNNCPVYQQPQQQSNGWKCPFCDEVSVTASAAHRHMEVHGIVKAYRCKICSYKGNTLRGMRTHIRMHSPPKDNVDFHEEQYVEYIVDENVINNNADVKIPTVPSNPQKSMESASADLSLKRPRSPLESDTDRKFHSCDMCDYSSHLKSSLLQHQKIVHSFNNKKLTNGLIERNHKEETEEDNNNKRINCSNEQIEVKGEMSDEMEIDVLSHDDDLKCASTTNSFATTYCNSCGISFNYAENYLAHKQFYCSSHGSDRVSNNNNNNNNEDTNDAPGGTNSSSASTAVVIVEKS